MHLPHRIWSLFTSNGHDQPCPVPTDPMPTTALEEKQQLLAHHVRLVCRGLSNGLFVFGSRGGLGKTKTILRTLARERVRPVVMNGHVTPLALYTTLFANSDSVVVIDDADNLYRNLAALGILRSALWGDDQGNRLVTYNSSALKIPASFDFRGRLILTANTLPRRNHAFDAVLSRIDVFELDASNEEVVEMMRQIAYQGYEGLSNEECQHVVEFIAEFAATRELSLRLLEPSYRKVIYAKLAGIEWKDLVRSQLEQIGVQDELAKPADSRSFDLACLRQVLEEFPSSAKEQEIAWCQMTGRSRATFFRLKRSESGRLEDQQS